MKIISKFKDFYDYIVQDHDADLVYVRNIKLVNKNLDKLFKRDDDSTCIPLYSKCYGYKNYKYRKNGELSFDNIIFGIYPFVFSQPVLNIYYKYNSYGGIEHTIIIPGRELVDKLLQDDKTIYEDAYKELIKLAQNEFNKYVDKRICNKENVFFSFPNNIKKDLKKCVWKTECPEIFYEIQSPVFTKYDYSLFQYGAYWDNWPEEAQIGNDDETYYVTDISFQKLNYNILKYWYNDLFDINTYINIENFLWSIKQEPESTPDNKTKIVAHGFDLKTSFRKM